jgi:hemerythrin-like metal-binding protein
MPYTAALSVKVAKFDEEHKKLIGYVDALGAAMKEGKGKEVIGKVLVDLVNYTKTHFKNEEAEMQKYNYPGYAEQKQQHTLFVAKAEELKKNYDSGNTMVSVQAITFLNTWIVNHIQKIDGQYSGFFNEKGVK